MKNCWVGANQQSLTHSLNIYTTIVFGLSRPGIEPTIYRTRGEHANHYAIDAVTSSIKGILSTSCVIFSYPKLLSIPVLTFIKWRLTPSYVAKDTIFWTKKTQSYRYQNYCLDDNIQIIWPSMWTRLEHAHCLETINNMWFLGKRETVNEWKKTDFDGFRKRWIEVKYLPNGTNAGYM